MKILTKITSRKFLMALAGVVIGLAVGLGVDSGEIVGILSAVASIISYINGEAKVDAARAANTYYEP